MVIEVIDLNGNILGYEDPATLADPDAWAVEVAMNHPTGPQGCYLATQIGPSTLNDLYALLNKLREAELREKFEGRLAELLTSVQTTIKESSKHSHHCLRCGAVVGFSDECEADEPHDYSLCDRCFSGAI